jgi:hypothetical protein
MRPAGIRVLEHVVDLLADHLQTLVVPRHEAVNDVLSDGVRRRMNAKTELSLDDYVIAQLRPFSEQVVEVHASQPTTPGDG